MTCTCCPHERIVALAEHRRMRREQQNNHQTTQRSIISIANIVNSSVGALLIRCIHVSLALEQQAHDRLMTSSCCIHERTGARSHSAANKKVEARTTAEQRNTSSTLLTMVNNSKGTPPGRCIHVSQVLEKQAHDRLMTLSSCMHEENDAAPAHKRMRRKQPPNSALQHHEHYSHRGQQRRKDMGCSAQGVELLRTIASVHRPPNTRLITS